MGKLSERLAKLEKASDPNTLVGLGPATLVWRRKGETTEEAIARGGGPVEDASPVFVWRKVAA